jgi:ABC-type transport system involved in cytochrome c biogenesis permease component
MKEMSNNLLIYCTIFTVIVAIASGYSDQLYRSVSIGALMWIVWLLAHFYSEKVKK